MTSLLGLFLLLAPNSGAQASCPPCHLELEEAGSFGDRDGPGALGAPRAWAMDTEGRLYAVSEGAPGWIAVFSPGGRFLRRLGGPTTLDSIGSLVVTGDSVFAFDAARPALVVLDTDGGVVRRTPLPLQVQDAVRLGHGDWLASGRAEGSGEQEARPFHLLSPDGVAQGSSGPAQPLDWRGVYLLQRRLTTDPRGGAWAVMPTAYHIDRIDVSGTLVDSLVVETDWFPPRTQTPPPAPDHPAPPEMLDITSDDEGNLVTLVRRAGPDWARALTPVPSAAPGGPTYAVSDPERAWASRVELLDTLGRRLAQTDTDVLLVGFLRPDRILGFRRDSGVTRWSVWSLRTAPGPAPVGGIHRGRRAIPVLALLFAALGLALLLLTGRLWRAPDGS